ncbi:hypothetical protein L6R29_22555 [Myxococcota bacterium]|nr:hypothetical protein [Myxococcota bacterium]
MVRYAKDIDNLDTEVAGVFFCIVLRYRGGRRAETSSSFALFFSESSMDNADRDRDRDLVFPRSTSADTVGVFA